MKSGKNHDSAQQLLDIAAACRYWPRGDRPPRRDRILGLVEAAVDWEVLEGWIRPFYAADRQPKGRPGYPLAVMIRITILGILWEASDRGLEHALYDSKGMCRFCKIDPWAPRPPSAASIRAFRTLLATSVRDGEILPLLFEVQQHVSAALSAAGFEFRPGIVREPILRSALSVLAGRRRLDRIQEQTQ